MTYFGECLNKYFSILYLPLNIFFPTGWDYKVWPEHEYDFDIVSSLNRFNVRNIRSGSLASYLNFGAFGQNFRMKVFRPRPILHPQARIEVIKRFHTKQWGGVLPDCFLAGHMTSHRGTVSLSHCGGMVLSYLIYFICLKWNISDMTVFTLNIIFLISI